jgi:zinc D-Ala-D-Ala carboxypeptidase
MRNAYFSHHSLVPASLWRWPNFQPREIACKGSGAILIDFRAMDMLQTARHWAGRPFHIHSAYRSELHNAMVGGAPRSYHLEGRAFDIGLEHFQKEELVSILMRAGFTGFGLHYGSFVHVDTGKKRGW